MKPFAEKHELKTWPELFKAVLSGQKTFDVRRNDREFHIGDTVVLQEWEQTRETYSGREVERTVTFVLHSTECPAHGLAEDFVVLGLRDDLGLRDERSPKQCPKCGNWCLYDGWDHTHAYGIGIGSCQGPSS